MVKLLPLKNDIFTLRLNYSLKKSGSDVQANFYPLKMSFALGTLFSMHTDRHVTALPVLRLDQNMHKPNNEKKNILLFFSGMQI